MQVLHMSCFIIQVNAEVLNWWGLRINFCHVVNKSLKLLN